MYHPPSKRKQLIQRTATYVLMCVSVVGLVLVLVLIMLGYQFNKSDGKIEQGGLVQFDSAPTGGSVAIDGASFGSRTPSKTTLTSGQHFISMQKSGYRTWQKSVDVVAGSVLWLNYTRFIPTDLKPASVSNFNTLSSSSPSPDSKWMALKDTPETADIKLANVTNDDVKLTTLTFPADSYTAPSPGQTQKFTLDVWDQDSRYILINHTYDGNRQEWLVVDTHDAANTKNITKLFGISPSKVVFSENNSQVLFTLSSGEVRRLDIPGNAMSDALLTNVAEFASYDQKLAYVTLPDPTTQQRAVGYLTEGATKARALRTFDGDATLPIHVTLSKYFGDTYVSVVYGEKLDIVTGDLPRSDSTDPLSFDAVASAAIPVGTQYLSSKTEGRFIVTQQGATYAVYDLELKKLTKTTLRGASPVTRELKWIDGYSLWSDQDARLRLYEFDGANQQDIMAVEPGFSALITPNNKYLYAVTKSEDGQYHLTRVKLVTS
jgi:hypothetical protein